MRTKQAINRGSVQAGTRRKVVRRRRSKWKIAFMAITGVIMLGMTLGMMFLGIMYYREGEFVSQFISQADVKPSKPTIVLSADGVTLAEFEPDKREPIKYEDIPEDMLNAIIAIEDHNFWTHPGVDIRGVGRAVVANLRGGRVEQGASTITQQLARNAFLSQDRTYQRKLREMMIAVQLEKRLTKKEILELYLNRVYFGGGATGIKAASKVYFGKPLKQLTLAEFALLAGLPQRPSVYAPKPGQKNEAALRRRNLVLQSMMEEGYIKPMGGLTAQQRLEKAKKEKLHLVARKRDNKIPYKAPYFTTWILEQVEDQFGQLPFEQGGWVIRTTLRYDMQIAAENALHRTLDRRSQVNEGAVVLIDTQGRVLAMVGGSDFNRTQYNAITQGQRQPGSSFKPIVYATAFDLGRLDPGSTLEDRPFRIGKWRPHNANGKFSGAMSASSALMNSVNIPAIHALEAAGIENVVTYAEERFGIKSKLDPVLPLALGASAVRPLEMAQAYTVFATHGNLVKPYGLAQVKSGDGNVDVSFTTEINRARLSSIPPNRLAKSCAAL